MYIMKNVLITGSSSGLGFSLSNIFKDNGYDVYRMSRSESSSATHSLLLDFQNKQEIDSVLPDFIEDRNFDYLFLNAGTLGPIKKSKSITTTEVENNFQVNVLASKQILDYCINNGNSIKNVIAISSGASVTPYDGMFLYCLAKSAFRHLISCYALENENIHFLSLAPGIIKTKMQDLLYTKDSSEFKTMKKFHDLYDNDGLASADEISKKIFNNLEFLNSLPSGNYYDLRDI